MATLRTATIQITNHTDGQAWIQLFHRNSTQGQHSGQWLAAPGQTVGPLTVAFETGLGAELARDFWCVVLRVQDGSTPGTYISQGSLGDPEGFKECQLQHEDAQRTLDFGISAAAFDIRVDSGGCTAAMKRLSPSGRVSNVFVVMLENRSFDHLFAMSGIPGLRVATPADANRWEGTLYPVRRGAPASMPTDPGHEFADVVEQLGGEGAQYPQGGPYPPVTMAGFAANYATTTSEGPAPVAADIGDIMACCDTPAQLPVAWQLATQFAICDHWFSSLPGPTLPNRFFLHGASSAGLDDSPSNEDILLWETGLDGGFTYPNGSIYEAMARAGIPYRFYNDRHNRFSDDPQDGCFLGALPFVATLRGVPLLSVKDLAELARDLHDPYPHAYTFIEPNYGDMTGQTYRGGSSQHPMDDLYGGEALLKSVYESIRNSPLWPTSLLVIVYDEHGGFYDSVPPGPAVAPADGAGGKLNQHGFDFTRYGVRVPAIVVSPLIPAGTVDHTVYDHSSVLATVEKLFGLAPLTQRDAHANAFDRLLSLPGPRTDCPARLASPAPGAAQPAPAACAADPAQPLPPSGNVRALLHVLAKADYELAGATAEARAAALERLRGLRTVGHAHAYIAEVRGRIAAARAAREGAGAA